MIDRANPISYRAIIDSEILNSIVFFFSLVCAKTDPGCNLLCGGFSNSEIRLWDLGQNNVKRKINCNISELELACNVPPEPEAAVDYHNL